MKEKYLKLVNEWAETDSRWIKNGESRLKWRRIRQETINGWFITKYDKESLLAHYDQLVKQAVTIRIKKAPEKGRIAVSLF